MYGVRKGLAAGVIVVSASLTGCGGGDSSSTEEVAEDELISVTLGSLPIAQAAPLVYAEEQGVFEDNGIDLTIEFVEAAAVVPGVLSSEFEFGYLSAPAVLAARSNDVPVKSVVTMSNNSGDPAEAPIQIVVPSDSDISSPADLVGATIATDLLFHLPDLGMRGALMEEGIDDDDVEIVEIPFPEMGAALAEGRVDAATISEPFSTILRNEGAITDVLSTSIGQSQGSPQSIILASEEYIDQNPEAVERFQTAVDAAIELAVTNDEEMRATISTFTELNPQLASEIRLAPLSTDDTLEGWQDWADLLLEVGAIDDELDAAEAYLERD